MGKTFVIISQAVSIKVNLGHYDQLHTAQAGSDPYTPPRAVIFH